MFITQRTYSTVLTTSILLSFSGVIAMQLATGQIAQLMLHVFVALVQVYRRQDSVGCPATHLCHCWQGVSEHAANKHQPVLYCQWRVRRRLVSYEMFMLLFLFCY